MSQGTPISIPIGTDGSFQVPLLDQNGNAVTSFTSSDMPFAQAWQGVDTAVTFSPSCTWISAPSGTISLAIVAASTANLELGKYRLRVGVTTASGKTYTIPDTFLELTPSPGTAAPLAVYCSLRDLLLLCPKIQELQDSNADETGFATERNRSRQWLDRVIQRNRYNISTWGIRGVGGVMYIGNGWAGWYGQGQDDPILQGYLDDNLLMVAPPRIVATMTANKTLGYICRSQIGLNEKDTAWQRLGREFDSLAEEMAMQFTAEIDINGDGYADVVIPCGRTTLR